MIHLHKPICVRRNITALRINGRQDCFRFFCCHLILFSTQEQTDVWHRCYSTALSFLSQKRRTLDLLLRMYICREKFNDELAIKSERKVREEKKKTVIQTKDSFAKWSLSLREKRTSSLIMQLCCQWIVFRICSAQFLKLFGHKQLELILCRFGLIHVACARCCEVLGNRIRLIKLCVSYRFNLSNSVFVSFSLNIRTAKSWAIYYGAYCLAVFLVRMA